jgi:hypothetical protein
MRLSSLFLFILLGTPSVFAQIERDPETDIFYKFGAGARFRQYYFKNSTAGALPFDEDYISSSHRAQIDLTISKGEYFKTYFRAIHQGTWGKENTDQDNFLVQQAWGDWKVTDFLNLRFGRQAIQVGRGLVYGYNEWENSPNYYDGFSGIFDWDVLEFSLHALKIHELNKVAGASVASDPEVSHFILDINLKQMSDYIRMASINFIQVDGDMGEVQNTTTLLNKQSIQRFGFDFITDGVNFRSAGTLNYVTGTENTTTRSLKVKQLLLDGEARLILPDWQQFNFWAGAHYDTGDNDTTDEFNEQYEPLNYNFHVNAGRLDLFKFGNLTFLRTGMSMNVFSSWEIGVEGYMFDKSESTGATNFFRTPVADRFASGDFQLGTEKSLGTEVDVWVARTFPSGVQLELSLNYFAPGAAFKQARDVGNNLALAMDKQIFNVILDLGFFF